MLHDRVALTNDEVVTAFHDAADVFLTTLENIAVAGEWDAHGLGEWTVRQLAAHTLRAFTTIEIYLASEHTVDVDLETATNYFRVALADPTVHIGIAERGREGALTLTDPVGEARAVADRVLAVVDGTDPERVVETFVGGLAFREYLAGRVVELTLHTTDLQAATGQPIVAADSAAEVSFHVLAPLATPTELIRSITGRASVNVLG
ncbi:MAG: hypothetical protein RLZZ623_240 [Actinomycetota bacterium]|jgi:Mycothiol maleylpyruvate isomerase N-terminal domain